MSQNRILVVDDERFFREAIRDALQPSGFELVFATDGQTALDEITEPRLAVVILDLQLPDLHGLEVFRRLREARPELRVIILSAHTDQDYVLEALRLGACDYLAKPIHAEELSLAVGRAMASYDLAASHQRLRSRIARLDDGLSSLRARARSSEADAAQLREDAVLLLAKLVDAGKTSLLVPDDVANQLRVAAASGGKVPTAQMDPVAIGEGVAGVVWERAEAMLVDDVRDDVRLTARGHAERYDSPSFAVAPVAAGGGTLGVLCASNPLQGDRFDEDDLSLLRIFAGELAGLMNDAPAGNAAAAPAEDDERAAALAREICEAVTAEIEPTRILEAVLRPVSEALSAAPVALYLTTASGDALGREAQWDAGLASDRERLEAPRGLTGSVLESGRLVATGDPAADPRFDPSVDTAEDGTVRPLLCGPLRFRNKTLGVFRVFPESPEDASPELGEVLGATLSAAVRNVLLYRSLLETIEEVAVARKSGQRTPVEGTTGAPLPGDEQSAGEPRSGEQRPDQGRPGQERPGQGRPEQGAAKVAAPASDLQLEPLEQEPLPDSLADGLDTELGLLLAEPMPDPIDPSGGS